jgi:peptide/nickel transport system permease protein
MISHLVPTQEKPRDLLSSGAGLGAAVAAETHGELGEVQQVRARGYWEQVWRRFKRDKAAIVGGLFIIFLFIIATIGGPILSKILGHGPNVLFFSAVDPNTQLPAGNWSHVSDLDPTKHSQLFVLGADGTLGRDEFLRLIYGARTSLEVAIGATLLGMAIGVILGSIAGYYKGWVDTIVSRLTEIVMAFPVLLFVIALAATIGRRLDTITFGFLEQGVFTLVLVIGIFGWFYPARIIRAQVLSLREKEFIEAARMVGASDMKIIRSHLLPHLVGPIIVYSTLVVATNILLEAGLSFLGLGIKDPTSSWGSMLNDATNFYTVRPWLMVWPGLAVLLATLSFNLLGDGLRDAFDPRGSR